MSKTIKGLIFPVAVVVLWELLTRVGYFTSTSLSHPSAILLAGWELARNGELYNSTRETFGAAVGGMAIGVALGLVVGIAFGLSRLLSDLMRMSTEVLRPIPSVALIPLALLIYGYGYRMEILVVAFACFWPVMIVTEAAVRGVEPRLLEVARVLKFPILARVTKIILPAALPRVFVGLRLAAAISLVVAVTVEITTNPIGLGYGLVVAQESDRADRVFAYLIWIGFLGWLLNVVLLRAQQRWFGKYGNWMETAR